jgi:Ca2+/H+ antiporter
MKVINWLFIVLFVFSAALQYNDPDPYVWMPLYLYGAFLCYQATRKKYNPTLYFIGIVIYVSYAAYLFFDKTGVLNWTQEHNAESIVQSMHAEKPWIEETREFFGLIILIATLLINSIWLRNSSRNKHSTAD